MVKAAPAATTAAVFPRNGRAIGFRSQPPLCIITTVVTPSNTAAEIREPSSAEDVPLEACSVRDLKGGQVQRQRRLLGRDKGRQ